MSTHDLRSELPSLFVELSLALTTADLPRRADDLIEALRILWPERQITHFVSGIVHARARRFEEAEGHYRAALAGEPENPGIQAMLAEVLIGLDRWDEAKRLILGVLDNEQAGPARTFAEELRGQLTGVAATG